MIHNRAFSHSTGATEVESFALAYRQKKSGMIIVLSRFIIDSDKSNDLWRQLKSGFLWPFKSNQSVYIYVRLLISFMHEQRGREGVTETTLYTSSL